MNVDGKKIAVLLIVVVVMAGLLFASYEIVKYIVAMLFMNFFFNASEPNDSAVRWLPVIVFTSAAVIDVMLIPKVVRFAKATVYGGTTETPLPESVKKAPEDTSDKDTPPPS